MATIRMNGFLTYHAGKYMPEDRRWSWLTYDPADYKDADRIAVRPETITVEVPDDFDPRDLQVQMLRRQEQMLRAQFAKAVKDINDEINSLLALTNEVEA